MIPLALALLAAGLSILLLGQKVRLDGEVKAGRLKIKLAEGITGVSYQIAACEVFGSLFGLVAIVLSLVAFSYVGT